jgi:hypothetical protein
MNFSWKMPFDINMHQQSQETYTITMRITITMYSFHVLQENHHYDDLHPSKYPSWLVIMFLLQLFGVHKQP